MGEGVFEGDQPYFGEELTLAAAFDLLREGTDPADFGDGNCTHYSPCDEGCRHGGPGRWTNGGAMGWGLLADSDGYPDVREAVRDRLTPEAAWRPVDVRTLGWPHDLRFEKLAVLCLRCWAARMGDGVHA